jgi:hypothetical protein
VFPDLPSGHPGAGLCYTGWTPAGDKRPRILKTLKILNSLLIPYVQYGGMLFSHPAEFYYTTIIWRTNLNYNV